jgi:hypothetical protein
MGLKEPLHCYSVSFATLNAGDFRAEFAARHLQPYAFEFASTVFVTANTAERAVALARIEVTERYPESKIADILMLKREHANIVY